MRHPIQAVHQAPVQNAQQGIRQGEGGGENGDLGGRLQPLEIADQALVLVILRKMQGRMAGGGEGHAQRLGDAPAHGRKGTYEIEAHHAAERQGGQARRPQAADHKGQSRDIGGKQEERHRQDMVQARRLNPGEQQERQHGDAGPCDAVGAFRPDISDQPYGHEGQNPPAEVVMIKADLRRQISLISGVGVRIGGHENPLHQVWLHDQRRQQGGGCRQSKIQEGFGGDLPEGKPSPDIFHHHDDEGRQP